MYSDENLAIENKNTIEVLKALPYFFTKELEVESNQKGLNMNYYAYQLVDNKLDLNTVNIEIKRQFETTYKKQITPLDLQYLGVDIIVYTSNNSANTSDLYRLNRNFYIDVKSVGKSLENYSKEKFNQLKIFYDCIKNILRLTENSSIELKASELYQATTDMLKEVDVNAIIEVEKVWGNKHNRTDENTMLSWGSSDYYYTDYVFINCDDKGIISLNQKALVKYMNSKANNTVTVDFSSDVTNLYNSEDEKIRLFRGTLSNNKNHLEAVVSLSQLIIYDVVCIITKEEYESYLIENNKIYTDYHISKRPLKNKETTIKISEVIDKMNKYRKD